MITPSGSWVDPSSPANTVDAHADVIQRLRIDQLALAQLPHPSEVDHQAIAVDDGIDA